MDPLQSAQDVHRCDLCEIDIVYSYCDFCHINLCKPCVVDHISDGYDKHTIVPFKERRSTLIYPKCENHPHKTCKLQCKDCNNIFVCSSCMASERHKRHIFEEISEVYKTKKQAIQKDAKELNLISPTYDEIAHALENQLVKLDGGYEKLTTTMSKQGEQWHREIDIVINKMKTEISEIKVKHRDILQKHLDEIKQIQSLISQTLVAIKELEKSTEVSPVIEYNSKIQEFSKSLPKVQVSLPSFIAEPINHEKLCNLFGHITPLSTNTEKIVWSLNQPNTFVRKLLDEPELVATIQTGYGKLRNVACHNGDMIWASGKSNKIKCFNIKGSLVQTIWLKSGTFPCGVIVNREGDLVFSDNRTKVYKLKNGQTKELIKLNGWLPGELCVTSTGDLLVTMNNFNETQSKVVRYSGSTEKQTIQFDDEGKPLYSVGETEIKYITENRNHDICVADYEAGAVVVVNEDGKLRWRYTGHPSVTKNKSFQPYGITSDSQSRILTSDRDNHCIHILDQNGQFLRYIDNCGLESPFGLSVDKNDNVFVCELFQGNVKKIKYST